MQITLLSQRKLALTVRSTLFMRQSFSRQLASVFRFPSIIFLFKRCIRLLNYHGFRFTLHVCVKDCGEDGATKIGKILEGQKRKKNLQYRSGLNQREIKSIEEGTRQDFKAM
jgi:hypothetical protein